MDENRIDYFLKIGAAIVTLSFAASYAYQFAFLLRLGIFFTDVPLSLTDISKSALGTMPIVLAYGVLALGMNFYLPIWDNRRSKKEAEAAGEDTANYRPVKITLLFRIIYVISVLIFLCFWFMFSSIVILFYLLATCAISYILGRYRHQYGDMKLSIYLSFPLLLAVALYCGDSIASILAAEKPSTEITYSDGSKNITTLLNTYEAGILTFDNSRPHFTKWDNVKTIDYKKTNLFPSLLCEWDGNIKEIEIPFCRERNAASNLQEPA